MAISYVNTNSTQQLEQIDRINELLPVIEKMGLTLGDLQYLPELTPYLILDGHRTGISDHESNPARGYIEGAIFSLRFSRIFQELGGKKAIFLIHTLRNYSTMDRMASIFDAVGEIGKKFIQESLRSGIKLQYYGENVHSTYALSTIINTAEVATRHCEDFELNFLTNYSESWANENFDQIADLPNIDVIGRFTKGHFSGAGVPSHADKANFLYIQQASVSENWTDKEIVILILSLLKSYLSLHGFIGGKTYDEEEREAIRKAREFDLYEDILRLNTHPRKRITSFTPKGPITVFF